MRGAGVLLVLGLLSTSLLGGCLDRLDPPRHVELVVDEIVFRPAETEGGYPVVMGTVRNPGPLVAVHFMASFQMPGDKAEPGDYRIVPLRYPLPAGERTWFRSYVDPAATGVVESVLTYGDGNRRLPAGAGDVEIAGLDVVATESGPRYDWTLKNTARSPRDARGGAGFFDASGALIGVESLSANSIAPGGSVVVSVEPRTRSVAIDSFDVGVSGRVPR
jgi:hypothetical protein